MPNIYSFANFYLRQGFVLIPCKGKKPILSGWPTRTKTDLKEVQEWIVKWPEMNLGAVLGRATGLVGVDVDGRQALRRFKELNGGVPDTWSFSTPGGGYRFLFKLPEGCLTAKKFVEHFEGDHAELAFLGDGQQTILPPSKHPNGKAYRWLEGKSPGEVEVKTAPGWMLDLMQGRGKELKQKKRSQGHLHPTLKHLTHYCPRFKKSLYQQEEEGLAEQDWFLWISLLVKAGQKEAAQAFSELSDKHGPRSAERIEKMKQEEQKGTPRCQTLGCSEGDVRTCFPLLNRDEKGRITNSPGKWLREKFRKPPFGKIYAPFKKALRGSSKYDLDESGNLVKISDDARIQIANFLARPVKEIIYSDGEEETRHFQLEGVLAGGETLSPVTITSGDFPALNWIYSQWGVTPRIAPRVRAKEEVRDAIQHCGFSPQVEKIYMHTGWLDLGDEKPAFLHAHGALGRDDVRVSIPSELESYSFPQEIDDLKRAARASLQFLDVGPRRVTLPLLASAYLSPLVHFFKEAGKAPQFVLWLFGTTGTRKTSLALMLLSHFGDFSRGNIPASFRDTPNSLEKKSFLAKDALLLIDDYHPSSNPAEKSRLSKVAQQLLRMFGDRVGRGRLTSSTELRKTYSPRGMALVTGEELPTGQSSVARFLGLELGKNEIDLKQLSELQKKSSLLNEAMAGFLEWIISNRRRVLDELARVEQIRERFQSRGGHGRTGEALSFLFISVKLMTAYFLHLGVLAKTEREDLICETRKILLDLLDAQASLTQEEDPVDLFFEILEELLSAQTHKLLDLSKSSPFPQALPPYSLGFFDRDYVYLLPGPTYEELRKKMRRKGADFPISGRALWKKMEEDGILKVGRENGEKRRSLKKKIKFDGKEVDKRVLWIYRDKFEKFIEL